MVDVFSTIPTSKERANAQHMEMLRKPAIPIVASVILILLVGSGGYLLGRNAAAAKSGVSAPPSIPLPAHTTVTRTEDFYLDNTQNWYYTVPNLSENAITAFYQAQLAKGGWRCFSAMQSTNMTYYGQPLVGTSVYITATKGAMKAQIYLGDQAYGTFLLADDLPDGTIALKISLEPAKANSCP